MDTYSTSNGLTGMMRDVIIRLCDLMGADERKICAIIGMSEEHFIWRKHLHFVKCRKTVNYPFLPKAKDYFKLTGNHCSFTSTDWHTVFLDKSITKGIWRWNVNIKYGTIQTYSYFYLGMARFDFLPVYENMRLGDYAGSACLTFGKNGSGFETWIQCKSMNSSGVGSYTHDLPVLDNSNVAAETDIDSHTLCFFAEGKKVQYVISFVNIPVSPSSPLYFGISGSQMPSFTSVSLCRLQSSTPSSVPCEYYSWAD